MENPWRKEHCLAFVSFFWPHTCTVPFFSLDLSCKVWSAVLLLPLWFFFCHVFSKGQHEWKLSSKYWWVEYDARTKCIRLLSLKVFLTVIATCYFVTFDMHCCIAHVCSCDTTFCGKSSMFDCWPEQVVHVVMITTLINIILCSHMSVFAFAFAKCVISLLPLWFHHVQNASIVLVGGFEFVCVQKKQCFSITCKWYT